MIEQFESGKIFTNGKRLITEDLPWNPHSIFKGVFLKHLIQGAETNGKISCHLVKIDPECEIGEHIHEGKFEVHEVIDGDGICQIEKESISYRAGSIALIPENKPHKVIAGKKGLLLLAKFTPSLL